ncbi:MAG: glycosyltransferase family 2 protein [Nanoarchaeota archaeon]
MVLLSVIIPAYNEENTIIEVLNRVKKVNLEKYGIKKEIIVVSDGSTDNTMKYARSFKETKVIDNIKNQGKGAAVRKGIKYSTGDIIIIQDADLEYNPEEYYLILKPILEGKAEVVYGSRFLHLLKRPRETFFIRKYKRSGFMAALGGRIITIVTNILYRTNLTDEPTCYKCFKSSVIKSINIESNRFNWEPEVTAKIAKKGIKIHEVPIAYKPRTFQEGKKINWKDGFQAILTLLKYRIK